MKKLFCILTFFIATAALAQNKAFKERADKAFISKDYVTAAYYYEKALQNNTTTKEGTVPYFSVRNSKRPKQTLVTEIDYKLAESYRLYQNFIAAEDHYRKVVDKNDTAYPLARLWYAVCLRANNHLDDAINQLQLFLTANQNNKINADLGKKELNNCLFAKDQLKKPAHAKALKMASTLNADAADFALTINNGRFWFTSSRTGEGNEKRLNDIYITVKDSSGVASASATAVDLKLMYKLAYHYGTPSLEASGKRVYLTIWYMENGKVVSAIYLSRFVSNRWTIPQKLNSFVNADRYNAMQPHVTADGKRLYFVSDRPGSYGGTDIWMSDLDIEGNPTNTVNLGNIVNSTEDEQSPYYNERTHKLYYSSKGFVGMGDFDLFESENTGALWSAPKNLGFPYNSTKADLYYYPDDKEENLVYISSDRESECCLSLFKVKYTPPVPGIVLAGLVLDCATNTPLPNAVVVLVDAKTKKTFDAVNTSVNGKYEFSYPADQSFVLRIEKPGYFTKVLTVPKASGLKKDTLFNPAICQQQYEIDKPVVINNILYDFNKAILKPQAKSVLDELVIILTDNPKIKVELSSHTDSFGPDWSNNRLSQQRAQACVDYILSKGIDPSRITAKGYGESRPRVPNSFPDGTDNPAGRRQNRRTEFKVLSDE
ncbi:OmpA family protein [Mucilaginibacter lacusdianchii]|uniref:OmpA family protein n=1 Tax=Mucilaginibacter lacusdianchii TaxID=2684211 RepID=UPI00131E4558|nr:OmpA family protein [Mucilaginibacter sp. JXJ CY 39]